MSTKKTNSTPSKSKPFIRKGDLVMVVAGADKGKQGNIMEVFHAKNRVIVEDVNIVKKHRKPTQSTPGGPTRVGRKIVDGKSVRYAKKSGEIIK